MINKHIRKFLIRSTGLTPAATDKEAQEHLDRLHPDLQDACRKYAEAEEEDEERSGLDVQCVKRTAAGDIVLRLFDVKISDIAGVIRREFSGDGRAAASETQGGSAVQRTVYAASGPGVQQDLSAGDQLAMAFGHMHQARILGLPTQYDQISGPEVLEPGVRVTFAMHPQTLDKQPIAVQFDSTKFTEDQARAWLSERNIKEYTFLPDQRDKTPVTQGNPRAEGEKPPRGFSDLNSFYSGTIPLESEQGKASNRAAAVGAGASIRTMRPRELECPSCGGRFDDDPDAELVTDETRYCPICGESLPGPMVTRAAPQTEPFSSQATTEADEYLCFVNRLERAVDFLESPFV